MEPEPDHPVEDLVTDLVKDTKDWTWTLTRRCPDCGLAAGEVEPAAIADRAFVAAEEWAVILRSNPAVGERPSPTVWSPLEYGCHVRDVYVLFDSRIELMRTEQDPSFANWDQDEAATAANYGDQDPDRVADELEAAAEGLVARLRSIGDQEWSRRGTRSNGDEFSVATTAQYFLHDVVHHLWDVTGQQDGAASLQLES